MLIDGVYIMAVVRFIFGKVNKKNEAMNSDAKLVCFFYGWGERSARGDKAEQRAMGGGRGGRGRGAAISDNLR